MNVTLEIVHSIRGRARIRVRSQHDPAAFFVVIHATLQELEEVRRVELNPYARSVTLHFPRSESLESVLERWKSLLFSVMSDPSFPDHLEQIEESQKLADGNGLHVRVRDRILTLTRTVDHAVKRVTGNTLDMRTALPVGAFTAGVATLALAPALPTPTWLVLLIFSFTSFNIPKNEEPLAREVPAPVALKLPRLTSGGAVEAKQRESS